MMTVIAHRGDSQAARENTIAAFEAAVEVGVDWVEIDLRTTADGVSIVLHDASLLRLWGDPHTADQLGIEAIQRLGTPGCRVPTLAEVLDAVASANARTGRRVGVLVDTVSVDDALAGLEVIASHPLTSGDAPELPIRWCGDTQAMLAVRERAPQAVVAYNHDGGPLPMDLVRHLAPRTINVEWTLVTPELVAQVHRLGLDLACWTVDHAEQMTWLIDSGVDHVTSNRPRLLRQLVDGQASPLGLAWLGPDAFAARAGITREHASWICLARELALWTNQYTATAALGTVQTKAHAADIVTEVDTAVEQHVRAVIAESFPEHLVVGEEMGGHSEPGRPTWYLDPVDGTTNLANHVPWTSMSLALAVDDQPLVAVVAQPAMGRVFLAARGMGAIVDGAPLSVARCRDLAGTTVFTELSSHDMWPGMASFIDEMAAAHATTRIMGSGTLAMTAVGAGWAAGSVIHEFNPIDHLAGLLVSQEAGAVVLDQSGEPTSFPADGGVLVARPGVERELHEAWRRSLGN